MVPSVFRPGPLLAGAHTSAHPASRRMRHSPSSVRLLRWTLIVRICCPSSAQPFLHVCPASRCHWHGALLHRARHAWHPCCLALCFMGSLLNADPLAGPGCVARAWGPCRGPSPGPHAACLSPLGCLTAVSSPLVMRPVAQACSFLSDPLPWCPAASSPPVSGCFLSACLRPVPLDRLRSIPLDLFQTRSSHLVTRRFHSACIRPVALGCFPVGSSLLAFGLFVSAGVRPCPRC